MCDKTDKVKQRQNQRASALPLSSGPAAAGAALGAEELQDLWDETQQLQQDTARDAQVQQLAQLERHSCLGQEVKELGQVCWGMLLLFWGSTGLSWECVVVLGGAHWAGLRPCLPSASPQRLVEMEAVRWMQLGKESPEPAHLGAITGSGR